MIVRCLLGALCVLILGWTGLGPIGHARADDWEDVVASGKKEGEVIIWGQAGDLRRRFWKDAFEKAYPDIKVRLFQPNNGSERDTRYLREFQSGIAKVDILMSSSGGINGRLKPAGAIRPLKPLLRPEVLAPDKWMDGAGPIWVDSERQYIVVSDLTPAPALATNQSLGPSAIQNWTDLLDPKFDGKIVMGDPRQAGQAFAMTLFLYYNPALGPDFVARLFDRGRIVFSPDERLNVEWIDSGRMLAGIYPRQREVEALQKVGGTLQMIPALKVDGALETIVVGSDGAIAIPNLDPLPHPNATRVYANWLLSRDGQQALVDVLGVTSTRTDVDMSRLPPYMRWASGVKYTNANDERLNGEEKAKEMRALVSKVTAGR